MAYLFQEYTVTHLSNYETPNLKNSFYKQLGLEMSASDASIETAIKERLIGIEDALKECTDTIMKTALEQLRRNMAHASDVLGSECIRAHYDYHLNMANSGPNGRDVHTAEYSLLRAHHEQKRYLFVYHDMLFYLPEPTQREAFREWRESRETDVGRTATTLNVQMHDTESWKAYWEARARELDPVTPFLEARRAEEAMNELQKPEEPHIEGSTAAQTLPIPATLADAVPKSEPSTSQIQAFKEGEDLIDLYSEKEEQRVDSTSDGKSDETDKQESSSTPVDIVIEGFKSEPTPTRAQSSKDNDTGSDSQPGHEKASEKGKPQLAATLEPAVKDESKVESATVETRASKKRSHAEDDDTAEEPEAKKSKIEPAGATEPVVKDPASESKPASTDEATPAPMAGSRKTKRPQPRLAATDVPSLPSPVAAATGQSPPPSEMRSFSELNAFLNQSKIEQQARSAPAPTPAPAAAAPTLSKPINKRARDESESEPEEATTSDERRGKRSRLTEATSQDEPRAKQGQSSRAADRPASHGRPRVSGATFRIIHQGIDWNTRDQRFNYDRRGRRRR